MDQQRGQMQKPRLEIPDSSKLTTNASSPRSMHGFPQSPQSPQEISPSSAEHKSFEDWSTAPFSPDLGSSEAEKKSRHFYMGEFVLVRCNHSKWLLGQVRRSSRTGVIVWVGAAQTLVSVPYDLLVSHLVKLDSPSLPASPSSSLSGQSPSVGKHGELMVPFRCVRPSHLSHRKLFQPLEVPPEAMLPVSETVMVDGSTVKDSMELVRGSLHQPTNASRIETITGSLEVLQVLSRIPRGPVPYSEQTLPYSPQVNRGTQLLDTTPWYCPEVITVEVTKGARVVKEQYALFRFRFEDHDFISRFSEECDWITIIENGLDIRKKQTRFV